MIIGQHRLYLGLLEHDFGDPDLVGRIAHTPWKLATVGVKPREETLPQLAKLIRRVGGFIFVRHLSFPGNGNFYLELFRPLLGFIVKDYILRGTRFNVSFIWTMTSEVYLGESNRWRRASTIHRDDRQKTGKGGADSFDGPGLSDLSLSFLFHSVGVRNGFIIFLPHSRF